MLVKLIKSKVLEKYPNAVGLNFSAYNLVAERHPNGVIIINTYDHQGKFHIYSLTKDCYIGEDKMEKELLIYDKGELLGSVVDKTDHSEDSCMWLHRVMLDEKPMEIVHIIGMDYAIVVPEEVATKMREILNNMMEEIK